MLNNKYDYIVSNVNYDKTIGKVEELKARLEELLVEIQSVLDEEYNYTNEMLSASSTSSTILNMVGAGAVWIGKKTWRVLKKDLSGQYLFLVLELYPEGLLLYILKK